MCADGRVKCAIIVPRRKNNRPASVDGGGEYGRRDTAIRSLDRASVFHESTGLENPWIVQHQPANTFCTP
ncbi:hypothetical protein KM043_011418 [Ampulex compressa]|nr:hypothetical protein KM043_011418 [Ampulex compressa]